MLNLKKTYDIQTEINEIKNILSKYTHIEYNPNCHICIKQPWIIQKLELENKLITLNNQINYSIFNPSKYIKRFNYLKNNLDYLKICINSIKKNSNFNHEILVHSNNSIDDTSSYLRLNNIKEVKSKKNFGLCTALNDLAKSATND